MKAVVLLLAAAVIGLLPAAPADAAPRAFVSSTGSGTTCTRAAPCATFQAAHDAVDPNGEINCIDSGSYGSGANQGVALRISKSITIDCAGTVAAIDTPDGTSGVEIDAAGVAVRLRNLAVRGPSTLGTCTGGISFSDGAMLDLENVRITGFRSSIGTCSGALGFGSQTSAKLYVHGGVISGNDAGVNTGGGSGVVMRVVLDGVRVEENTREGFVANGNVIAHIRNSVLARNGDDVKVFGNSSQITSVTVDRSSLTLAAPTGSFTSGIFGAGVVATGAGAFAVLGRSAVLSNVNGLTTTPGGSIISYQNNHLTGNATDGAPTATLTLK